ncbi:unnamed protein product [Ranitomeya imitator]|uniref:Nicolin-1 n=1 Tax=Ranitomeya imitator TaxID=111125 RepID=A0ABN9LEN4_9NEOB|nr:unnamed protein product [Ranitomeya imitator]
MAQEAAACTIRTPVPLQVGDGTSELGVSVIDVTFPAATPLNEISFRNFYTAFLTVKFQQLRPTATKKSRTWRTCVRNLPLMADPHMEEGSQDYVSVCRQQMACAADNVTSLRFILRQPSPVWLSFTLEELRINPPGRQSPQKPFSWWLSHLPPREDLQKLHKVMAATAQSRALCCTRIAVPVFCTSAREGARQYMGERAAYFHP